MPSINLFAAIVCTAASVINFEHYFAGDGTEKHAILAVLNSFFAAANALSVHMEMNK